MSDSSVRYAVFEGLVFNQEGQLAEVVRVGGEPFYVILDADFRRHVEAEAVDRQVLSWLHRQVMSNRELVTKGTLSLLGHDDLFTKAMIDASLEDLEGQAEQLMRQGIPVEARQWLGMLGLRIIVDVHGEVVEIDAPAAGPDEDL